MNYLSIDYLIVYAFLITTLIIGLRAGRGIKDIREYAIANKSYGTGALVLTYLATDFGGGSILDDAGYVFSDGIIMMAALSGLAFTFIFRALFIVPHMTYFDDCLTMGDIMENLYGTFGKVLSGVLGAVNAAIIAAMQFIVLGTLCESLLGIKAFWSVWVGGLAMAAYSAHGGIKAVTATDIFQFLVLLIVIPLTASLAIEHAGGIKAMFSNVPSEKLALFSHEGFSYYFTLFVMLSFLQIGMINPAIVQRMLMAKKGVQLRNQYLVVAAFDPTIRLAVMSIALAGVVMYPTVAPENIVTHIVQELLPVGVKGLAMAGLLGALMSTADSYLHAAGLTIARDVAKPLYNKMGKTINELWWARAATVFTGLGAIMIGLQAITIMDLAFIAAGLIGPLLMFPLISGIMGLKPDQSSFYVAILLTVIAFVTSNALLPASQSHLTMLISTIANGVGFFGTHIIRHGGFVVQRLAKGH